MLGERDKLVDLGWWLLWGAIATVWCVSAGHKLGPTFDEPIYVRMGLKNLRDLNHRETLTQGTMPLPPEVQMLPLRLAEAFTSAEPEQHWREWLPIARLGTLLFMWILLWGALRLGQIYGGVWGGRLAVSLIACEPILLGHGSLATTDVAFAACLVGLLAVFRGRRDEPTWQRRLVLPTIWVTLTFLAKASAMIYVPVCLAMVELERLLSGGWRPWSAEVRKQALFSLKDLAIVGGMGMVLLLAVCPRAPRGLLFQIRHNLDGVGSVFLFGELSPTGFWYYFPATLAIKLALSVFLMLAVVLVLRPRYLINGALITAAAMMALTPTFRVQLGVRFVLPIAALMLVGAAAALGRLISEPGGVRRSIAAAVASLCVAWSLFSAWAVWPNGMCYTNEMFGGTQRGYLVLSESNVDWGQGLNELADWNRAHGDGTLHLWYFGPDPAALEPPFHAINPQGLERGEELANRCRGGYLAASTSNVYGFFFDAPAGRYLRSLKPCGQTSTYLIYDFRRVP